MVIKWLSLFDFIFLLEILFCKSECFSRQLLLLPPLYKSKSVLHVFVLSFWNSFSYWLLISWSLLICYYRLKLVIPFSSSLSYKFHNICYFTLVLISLFLASYMFHTIYHEYLWFLLHWTVLLLFAFWSSFRDMSSITFISCMGVFSYFNIITTLLTVTGSNAFFKSTKYL